MKGAGRTLALALTLLLVAGTAEAEDEPDFVEHDLLESRSTIRPDFDPDTLLIRFRRDVSEQARADVLEQHGASVRAEVHSTRFEVIEVADAKDALRRLRGDQRVAAVELNRTRYAFSEPNDPLFATQTQYLAGIRLPQAWDVSRGASTLRIAVLDTGVDLDHPDLASRIVAGHDFVNDDPVAQDDNGHGTLIAGVAAARTNNGRGIAGAAWNASIMPVKVLNSEAFGYDSVIADGITWAADHGASVIVLALGAPWPSSTLSEAIQYARSQGAVVVAAAGNDGQPTFTFPAYYADLAVGATDASGDAAWFSNSGYWVDVAAPGIDVVSTALAAGSVEAYGSGSGTSLAAPLIAGIVALVRARQPELLPADVASLVKRVARDLGPRGIDTSYGHGFADAYAAVGGAPQEAEQPPGDQYEPNEVPARATPIAGTLSATIAPHGDEDVYAVDVDTPKWFSVTVTPPRLASGAVARATDPSLAVFGPDGGRLATSVFNTVGRREAVLVPASSAGRYLVDVTSRTTSLGRYDVTVADVPPAALLGNPEQASLGGYNVAIADVTGDGRKDILAENSGSLIVLPGREGGGFDPARNYLTQPGGGAAIGLDVGDLNRDGIADAVLATNGGPAVFLSAGGNFRRPPTQLRQPTPTRWVALGNVIGDRRRDVVAGGSDGSVWVFRNRGATFPRLRIARSGHFNVAIADMTGDGRSDVVSCSRYATAREALVVFVGLADGSFHRRRTSRPCGDDFDVGDVTGDGRADVVSSGGVLAVYAQTAGGRLAAPDLYEGGGTSANIAIGDLNGDGRKDVVGNAHFDIWLRQYVQLPNGLLAAGPPVHIPRFHDGPLAIGDVTRDGRADVIQGNVHLGVRLFRQSSSSAPPVSSPSNLWIDDVTPPDFSLDIPTTTDPTLDFTSDSAMQDGADLVSGITGHKIPVSVDAQGSSYRAVLRPFTGLAPGTPYLLARQPRYRDGSSGPIEQANWAYRFTTAGAPDGSQPDTALVGDPRYFDSGALFTFTTSKIGSIFECSLDGWLFAPCTSPQAIGTLAPGTHTFSVRSVDVAGRVDPNPAAVTWSVPELTTPRNDSFSSAFDFRLGDAFWSGISTGAATKEPGEPNHAGNPGGHSVWFTWRAPQAGSITIETRGSTFDTLLAAYTGSSVGALTPIASNDDVSPSDTTSRVTFPVSAGTTYRIAVDGKNGASGSLVFAHHADLSPPPSDDFADALELTGTTGTVVASNIGATEEIGEPESGFAPDSQSIWFRWTAPHSGLFSFDQNGTAAPRVFDLYTGSSLSSLTPIGIKSSVVFSSQIYLLATAGTTYTIRADNRHTSGEWVLNWSDGHDADQHPE